MTKIKLEHIERLSRGKRSGANIGSRSVGHYLRPYERSIFQRALKKGYLDVTKKDRANLWHVWEKACVAQKWEFLVLIKNLENDSGEIYRNNVLSNKLSLYDAKRKIKRLAYSNV